MVARLVQLCNNKKDIDADEAGEIHDDGTRFSMGRATMGRVRFTPDGELGFAVQEDGSVGVFSLSASGEPAVAAPTAAVVDVVERLPGVAAAGC